MAKHKVVPRIFYGWWIVLASTIAFAFEGGVYFYGFSAFFMPLVNEFGWSRAAISGAFSFSRLEGAIIGPIGGFLIDKFGPRKIMFLCIIMMGSGFILLSRIDSLVTFYLVFILLIAMGATVGIQQATVVAIVNWFIKKRGTAMGIGLSGVGVGGVIVPALAWLIIQYGWRQTAVITGLTILAIGIPLSLVMRHRPEQYGLLPDGETKQENETQRESEVAKIEPRSPRTSSEEPTGTADIDFAPRQALRTKTFWLLVIALGSRQLTSSAVVIHQIPFLIDLGISPDLAAAMLGSMAIISIVGRLGFGRLADIFETKYLMAICLALIALGCFILANAQTLWHVIAFLIIYAPGYGGGSTLMMTIRGEYFGRRHYGTISGFMDIFQAFGLVLGPVFAGWIFDVTGSYWIAFTACAVVAAIGMILMLIVKRPALRTLPETA
ncbi:MFS transporter [Chloroflexota bacterium]